MNDLSRRRVLNLTESDIRRMLRLPEGTGVLAISSEFDPPRIRVLLVNEDWPEVPPDSHAQPVHKIVEVVDGQALITFPELRKDGDPEFPEMHTEYRWNVNPLEPPPIAGPFPKVFTDKTAALALRSTWGGTVEMRLAGDWDALDPGPAELEYTTTPWSGERACDHDNPNGPGSCVRAAGHSGMHRAMSDGRWS